MSTTSIFDKMPRSFTGLRTDAMAYHVIASDQPIHDIAGGFFD